MGDTDSYGIEPLEEPRLWLAKRLVAPIASKKLPLLLVEGEEEEPYRCGSNFLRDYLLFFLFLFSNTFFLPSHSASYLVIFLIDSINLLKIWSSDEFRKAYNLFHPPFVYLHTSSSSRSSFRAATISALSSSESPVEFKIWCIYYLINKFESLSNTIPVLLSYSGE